MLRLSTKWQSLWSVISFYLEILFYISENAQLLRIAETHRCYDALQYPIIFWDGADGYHFNIKLMNPATNKEMNKKCSAMNYYSYRTNDSAG